MNRVETVRFAAADDVQLLGWHRAASNGRDDTVIIHVHGMSGNGFENQLVDALSETYVAAGCGFFSFNNRGAGVATWQRTSTSEFLGGACYERFEDCVHDISGAIEAMVARGYQSVVLQGHSLGCTKVVHYLTTTCDARVRSAILLAPTDMYGWAHRSDNSDELYDRALQLAADALVGERCWGDGPVSASTYLSYATPYSSADIYRNGALSAVSVPLQIVYGTEDMGIREIDGTFAQWRERTKPVLNDKTDIAMIDGAEHGFVDHLPLLCNAVHQYLRVLQPPANTMPSVVYDPSQELCDEIKQGVVAYNAQFAPFDEKRSFAVVQYDNNGVLIGGLFGWAYWEWSFIQFLWVHEDHRSLGVGSAILALFESTARSLGCKHIFLDTHAFQARPFYEKQGYSQFGELQDFPAGSALYFLKKDL